MKAPDVLRQAAELVGGERAHTHGNSGENFRKVAILWKAMDEVAGQRRNDATTTAIKMSLMKVARVYTGHYNPDDLLDACGYMGLAAELEAERAEHDCKMP